MLRRSPVRVVSILVLWWSLALAVVAQSAVAADAESSDGRLVFETDIAPILFAYCWTCHGSEDHRAELDLRTLPLMIRGGSGGPAIVSGSADNSLLFQKLQSKQMPPAGKPHPTAAHIETIRRWIESGAEALYTGGPIDEDANPPLTDEDRNWWSFRKLRPPGPAPSNRTAVVGGRARTPIDRFVLSRLASRGLTFSSDADPITLVRRVSLDLTGLPPSPADVDRYLAERAPDRFARRVDRLLASPDYGNRWARHWLDAAGYVDVRGGDNDHGTVNLLDGVWRYRDYVVDVFNEDLPYDRFLTEQIAGDELVPWRDADEYDETILRSLTATGFLRLAADKSGNGVGDLDNGPIRHQVINDTLTNFGTNILGLTVHCAQCHTHKFDPISHLDYYRLRALLAPAFNRQNWINSTERHLHVVPEARFEQFAARNAEIDAELEKLTKQIADFRSHVVQRLRDEKLKSLPVAVRVDAAAAWATPEGKRSAAQQKLIAKFAPQLKITAAAIDRALEAQAGADVAQARARIAELRSERHEPGQIQSLWDVGPPPRQYLLRRGDFQTPGAIVSPGVIAVLDSPERPFRVPDANPARPTSGYRTALAAWLTSPDHPLTARVRVNRVWQRYFDRGIVSTVENFGRSGAAPTHPQLLDWLAVEFIRTGWHLKLLHRRIVSSTVYRQASSRIRNLEAGSPGARADAGAAVGAAPDAVDPENRLLWRMPLRRLDSEVIRDSVLAVSGTLDRTVGGPPVAVKAVDGGIVEIDTAHLASPSSAFRRTIYIVSRRNYHMAELRVFDQPNVATNCTQRTKSAVVLQSLTLLNGRFAQEQSQHFADRVKGRAGDDRGQRVEFAFRCALSRRPSPDESALADALIAKQTALYRRDNRRLTEPEAGDLALRDLCQMLMNTSSFLYAE